METKKLVVSQEQIDKELDLAWSGFREEKQKAEICPCGHRYDQHNADENCTLCDCLEFGELIEDPQTFKEINLGGDICGFKTYE